MWSVPRLTITVHPPHLLDSLPLWFVFISMVFGLGAAGAAGYWLNRRFERSQSDEAASSVGALGGGALALLAFLLAMGILGLHTGYAERWNMLAFGALVLTLAVVFSLIIDLNRSQSGVFSVSQQVLIDLQRQLSLSM